MPGSWGRLIERARRLVTRGRRAGPSTLLATVRKSASIAATLDAQRAGFAEGVAGPDGKSGAPSGPHIVNCIGPAAGPAQVGDARVGGVYRWHHRPAPNGQRPRGASGKPTQTRDPSHELIRVGPRAAPPGTGNLNLEHAAQLALDSRLVPHPWSTHVGGHATATDTEADR